MPAHSLWTFAAVAALCIVTPGPDTALTVRNSLAGGRAAGVRTALGVVTGQIVWELVTCAGLVALLLASERVFAALRIAGAVYLVVLGLQSLHRAVFRREDTAAAPARLAPGEAARAFRQGLFSNLGNPKMAVFFAGVFPQFAPAERPAFVPLLVLGLLFSAMTLVWLTAYAFAVDRAARWARGSAFRRGLQALSGSALIALGARLGLARE